MITGLNDEQNFHFHVSSEKMKLLHTLKVSSYPMKLLTDRNLK